MEDKLNDKNGHHFNLLHIRDSDVEPFETPNIIKINDDYQYSIKDQKSTNSCTILATITLIEYLRQIQGLPFIQLSTNFLYHYSIKTNGKYKNGLKTISVLRSLLSNGVCDQKRWSSIFDFNMRPSQDAVLDALSRICDTTIEIIPNSINSIRYILGYCKRPIVAIINIFSGYDDNGNVIEPKDDETEIKPLFNHSILLTGYNDSENIIYFQNSYGQKWGNTGVGSFSYKFINHIINMFSMDESCIKSLDSFFEIRTTREIEK